MKKIILFYLVFCFTLISCLNTPEKKIIHNFKNNDGFRLKIESVEVIDTIYDEEISKILILNKFRIDSLNLLIEKTNDLRKSIEKYSQYSKSISNVLIKNNYERIKKYQNQKTQYELQNSFYEQIYLNYKDHICGYYILIKTENQELEYAITKEYHLLCPKFLLENF